MAIDRSHWKPPFTKLPSWLCPKCQTGSLSVDQDSFKIIETEQSLRARARDAWEPDWIEERFTGSLTCQNAPCGDLVGIVGRAVHVDFIDWDHPQQQHWYRMFKPAFMDPAPPIFPIPAVCPTAVAAELTKAFALFWSDTGSCANRMRAAAEMLLTERNVPRTTLNGKRKQERLSLHARIERFKEKDAESADYLLAIKWLGNAGSHANLDELNEDNLLDGFELFEHVIERVYVKREEHLKKIAKVINARKGRPTKPKRVAI